MRVVVDTNVLMSGIFWRGAPARVLDAWRDARFELVISKDVFEEYVRVADELRAERPGVDPRPFLRIVFAAAIMVDAPKLAEPVCADRDDDVFIAAALAGAAGFIVSGDKKLLAVSGYRGLQIMPPARFVRDCCG